MAKPGSLFLGGLALIVAGCILASLIQTSGGTRIQDVRFAGTDGTPMSALLYIPANATAKTPAPGILAVHGYFNSREVQDGFAIEFARRGYVVLAIDQTGHGYSGSPAFKNRFGGPDGLKYLRSLDFVDRDNIGIEGHSMGGWASVNAAAAYPDGYKALVLEGSSTGMPFAPEGTATFPHNIAVVYSKFDEFSMTMWNVPKARDVVESPKLKRLFDTTEAVVPGKIYGDIAQGTGRVLYTPPITHAQDHLSPQAIGYAVDWFQHTLSGGHPKPSSDQIWYWKEIGTLIAFVGFVVLLLGTFGLLLQVPWFSQLAATPTASSEHRDRRWWVAFLLTMLVPPLSYLPIVLLFTDLLPASSFLPQEFTNQIAAWAVLNGLFAFGVGLVLKSNRTESAKRIIPSIGIAVLTIAVGYGVLAIAGALFTVDFRFWFVGLKLMNRERFGDFLVYLIPFTIFAVLVLRAVLRSLPVKTDGPVATYLINIGAMCAGFVVFVCAEYIPMFMNGQLLTPGQGLYTILSVQFVPLLAIMALIGTFTWRRTNSYLPGAFICALFVTWYIVAGQAIQAI
jgi:pimeloyl-ACP methyl ester carboxylesterase